MIIVKFRSSYKAISGVEAPDTDCLGLGARLSSREAAREIIDTVRRVEQQSCRSSGRRSNVRCAISMFCAAPRSLSLLVVRCSFPPGIVCVSIVDRETRVFANFQDRSWLDVTSLRGPETTVNWQRSIPFSAQVYK